MATLRTHKQLITFIFVLLIVGVSAVVFLRLDQRIEESDSNQGATDTVVADSQAVKDGKALSNNKCEGVGDVTLTHLPMDEEDFAYIIPYGLMIGSHVTPVDHQYFAPTDRSLGRDSYPVYMMADAKIVNIQHRLIPESNIDEYRLVFSHSCTFFTYYDLVTSLTPSLEAEFNANRSNGSHASVDVDVKVGDIIGYIGGQTLDFAVWDMNTRLTGYITPEYYTVEPWKIHTSDPYPYFSSELQEVYLEKILRTEEPLAGKIDYDIDGRLIGNWFEKGTRGYAGTVGAERYWEGHLSFVYNHIDPAGIMVSIGDYEGEATQFGVFKNTPDPNEITVEDGVVKFQLVRFDYSTEDGHWDRTTLRKDLSFVPGEQIEGVLLVHMISDREIKVEVFPGDTSAEEFTDDAAIYER